MKIIDRTPEDDIAQNFIFKSAVSTDAEKVAELIHIAIDDIAEQLTGKTAEKDIRETLKHFFFHEKNRLSYQNITVVDILGEVAGIMLTYPGDEAALLDEPILEKLRKENKAATLDIEADSGDFYVDTLCVAESFRGHGIGTKLLEEAEKLAIKRGYSRISLNVSHDNSKAKSLYQQVGYKKEKEIQINKHPYDYMVKAL